VSKHIEIYTLFSYNSLDFLILTIFSCSKQNFSWFAKSRLW